MLKSIIYIFPTNVTDNLEKGCENFLPNSFFKNHDGNVSKYWELIKFKKPALPITLHGGGIGIHTEL